MPLRMIALLPSRSPAFAWIVFVLIEISWVFRGRTHTHTHPRSPRSLFHYVTALLSTFWTNSAPVMLLRITLDHTFLVSIFKCKKSIFHLQMPLLAHSLSCTCCVHDSFSHDNRHLHFFVVTGSAAVSRFSHTPRVILSAAIDSLSSSLLPQFGLHSSLSLSLSYLARSVATKTHS